MEFVFTPELLAGIVAAIISLAFSYIPGLSEKFAALAGEYKRLIMAGLMVVVAGAVYAGSCLNLLSIGVACDKPGVLQLISIVLAALIANQGVYAISPQTAAVRAAKQPELTEHDIRSYG